MLIYFVFYVYETMYNIYDFFTHTINNVELGAIVEPPNLKRKITSLIKMQNIKHKHIFVSTYPRLV